MSSVKSYLIYLYFLKETELVIVEMMLLSILELFFVIRNMYSIAWVI